MGVFVGGSFSEFVGRWKSVGSLLRDAEDFAAVVVTYAGRLAEQGCGYAEAIFSPAEPARLGVPWESVFEGYCDGARQARARFGVQVRLMPDITRSFTLAEAETVTLYYAAALSFTGFLERRYGMTSLVSLVEKLPGTLAKDDVWLEVVGRDLASVQQAWLASL